MHDDLALEWADIDGEGLVRVFPTTDFKGGFVMVAHIGLAAEKVDYFPEVLLTEKKVTVTIRPQEDGLDYRLAHVIDNTLYDAANRPADQ
jgi:pterin-4a-carbinolamine dehydratase